MCSVKGARVSTAIFFTQKTMPVSLEAVEGEAPAESPGESPPEEPPENIPEEPAQEEKPSATEPSTPEPSAPEPLAPPAPKRRGRPPKLQTQAPVAKAKSAAKRAPKRPPPPAVATSDSSSSDDSDDEMNRDEMETMLLSYLVQRKTNKQTGAEQCGVNWPD